MVSSHYVYRLKCDMGVVFTNSVNGYNLYEFKHQASGKIVPIIAKSALIEYNGQLAQEMIFKEAT